MQFHVSHASVNELMLKLSSTNLNFKKLYLRLTLCRPPQFTNDFLPKLHFSLELLDALLELPNLRTQVRYVIMLVGNLENERHLVTAVTLGGGNKMLQDFCNSLVNDYFIWKGKKCWPSAERKVSLDLLTIS